MFPRGRPDAPPRQESPPDRPVSCARQWAVTTSAPSPTNMGADLTAARRKPFPEPAGLALV